MRKSTIIQVGRLARDTVGLLRIISPDGRNGDKEPDAAAPAMSSAVTVDVVTLLPRPVSFEVLGMRLIDRGGRLDAGVELP